MARALSGRSPLDERVLLTPPPALPSVSPHQQYTTSLALSYIDTHRYIYFSQVSPLILAHYDYHSRPRPSSRLRHSVRSRAGSKVWKARRVKDLGYKELHRHMPRAQRPDRHRGNAEAIKKYLCHTLNHVGLASEVRAPKGPKNYALWGMESDSSLGKAEAEGQSC
jgi:hypothetical protein